MSLWNLEAFQNEREAFLNIMQHYAKELNAEAKNNIRSFVMEIEEGTEGKPEEALHKFSFMIAPENPKATPVELFFLLLIDKNLPVNKYRFITWNDSNKNWQMVDLDVDQPDQLKRVLTDNINNNPYWRRRIQEMLPVRDDK